MKKYIPFLIALLLILAIGGALAGGFLYKKYSYTKEEMELEEYFGVSGEKKAIILQDERIADTALLRNGVLYFTMETVKEYLNDMFYADENEGVLLYTDAEKTTSVVFGDSGYTVTDGLGNSEGRKEAGYPAAFIEGGTLYVAADYVKKFANFSCDVFDWQVQLYTEWGTRQTATIKKDTAVRYRGGVKSPILKQLVKGDKVEILSDLGDWSEVKTEDSVIGYVENKRLENYETDEEKPVTDYQAPEYVGKSLQGKVNLGFHSIGGAGGNITLDEMLNEGKGINVIAPTWISMIDNVGNIRNFGDASYVAKAHAKGIQVWGVADNFNYELETGTSLDTYQVLSYTSRRQRLEEQIIEAALLLGLDGINLDFEALNKECGESYGQFLREMSLKCRANGLFFSVDNYVPANYNTHYRLDVQGDVADYVIIMGYDEHWHGSQDPGSVASLDYVAGGIDKTLTYVPAEKIVNALPFYSILWRIEGSRITDEYVTMVNMADLLNSLSTKPVWDETTQQKYIEWNQGNARYEMWIEDEESIRIKLNLMSQKNIGGVAVWRLGYGTKTVWELISLYVNNM